MVMVAATFALAACSTSSGQALGPAPQGAAPAVRRASPRATTPKPRKAASPKPTKEQAGQQVVQRSQSCDTFSGGTEGSVAQLVDVRVGAHQGYDRVTFEFAPPSDGRYFGLPPYEVKQVDPPIRQDGSGEPVAVDGISFATIVFQGASGVEFTEDGYTLTYDGPKEFRPAYETLAEATETGDFEAVLSWAFGLSHDACPRVLVLQDPLRVAIDFQH
jgi:hypothetical protein